jgi:CHAD domain-containing protein
MKTKRLDVLSQRIQEQLLSRLLSERTRTAAAAATDLVRDLLYRGFLSRNDSVERRRISTRPAPSLNGEGNTLADHLGKLVDNRLERLSHCRHWRHAEDPVEAVHDLRVASRRLRAFINVFRPLLDSEIIERTEKPLRRVTRAARSLRDLDVQVELLIDRLEHAASDAERGALEHLLEQLETGRSRAGRRAEKRLGKVDFDELQVSVSAALGETVARLPHERSEAAVLARELLDPFVDQAAKDKPADDGLEYPEEMHRLRVDLKKLRYGMELFQPAFGDSYDALYARVEGLQELLGKHHDLVVLGGIVEELIERLRNKQRHTLLVGLETLRDQLLRERRQFLARFRAEGFEADWWRRSIRDALVTH